MDDKKIKIKREPEISASVTPKNNIAPEKIVSLQNKEDKDNSRDYLLTLLSTTMKEQADRQNAFNARLNSFLTLSSLSLVCESALLTSFYLVFKQYELVVLCSVIMALSILGQLINVALSSSLFFSVQNSTKSPMYFYEYIFAKVNEPKQENLMRLTELYNDIWTSKQSSLDERFKKLKSRVKTYRIIVSIFIGFAFLACVALVIGKIQDASCCKQISDISSQIISSIN